MPRISVCISGLLIALVLTGAACSGNDDTDDLSADASSGGTGGASGTGGSSAAGGSGGTGGSSGTGGTSGTGGSGGNDTGGSPADDDGGLDSDASVGEEDRSCLNGITDYASTGPFQIDARTIGPVKLWMPQVPFGCIVPVVHFANGTGASCSIYEDALEHLASHGFLAACYESPQTGQGEQCITAVGIVQAEFPELASAQRIGFTGNGTGGASALVCTHRAEEKWRGAKTLAAHALPPDLAGAHEDWMEIYPQIDSPIFIVNGSVGGEPTDGLVPEAWVRDTYEALNDDVEAYWYEGVEAAHIPVPISFIQESTVAWFRWKLLDDAAACAYVKAMPDSDRWNLQEQQNVVDCD